MGNQKAGSGGSKVMPFTFDEILDALKDQPAGGGPDGVTSAELADKLGVCQNAAQGEIRKAVKAGRMRFNGKRQTVGIDGRRNMAPVYTVV